MFLYFALIRNMELEEGNPEAQQSGTSILISGATRTGPVLSPSLINRSRAYVGERFVNLSFIQMQLKS